MTTQTVSAPAAPPRRETGRRSGWQHLAPPIFAFLGGAGLVLVYALRGGSYDLVAFEEHGLCIWWLLAMGLALGLLPRSRPAKPALVLLGTLAAYAAWTAVSLLWTSSSERTFLDFARALDYLGVVALIACVLDRKTWRAAAAGLGFGAVLVCAIAIGTHLAPGFFGADRVDEIIGTNRLSEPFGYWNAVAALGAMTCVIGVAWSAHDSSRVRRALALALVPVAGLATYLTYSRAGVFGLVLGLIAVTVFSRNRLTALLHALVAAAGSAVAIAALRSSSQIAHGTGTKGAGSVLTALVFAMALGAAVAVLTSLARIDNRRGSALATRLVVAGAAMSVLVLAVTIGPSVVSRAWHSFTHTAPAKASADPAARLSSLSGPRYSYWKVALRAFDDRPALGTGAATFEFSWNELGANGGFVRDAHNIWLQNMAELGVPGLLLIVAVAIAGLTSAVMVRRRIRRHASAGIAAAFGSAFLVYVVHATVDWMWQSTAVTVLALSGVAVLLPRLSRSPRPVSLWIRLLFVLAAVAAAAVQVPGLLSTVETRRSQAAARAGHPGTALAWARDAVAAEPWSATAVEQRGLVREQAGDLRRAARDLRDATSLEPQNYRHWLILSRIETELGRYGNALDDLRQARRLRPGSAVFLPIPSSAVGPDSSASAIARRQALRAGP